MRSTTSVIVALFVAVVFVAGTVDAIAMADTRVHLQNSTGSSRLTSEELIRSLHLTPEALAPGAAQPRRAPMWLEGKRAGMEPPSLPTSFSQTPEQQQLRKINLLLHKNTTLRWTGAGWKSKKRFTSAAAANHIEPMDKNFKEKPWRIGSWSGLPEPIAPPREIYQRVQAGDHGPNTAVDAMLAQNLTHSVQTAPSSTTPADKSQQKPSTSIGSTAPSSTTPVDKSQQKPSTSIGSTAPSSTTPADKSQKKRIGSRFLNSIITLSNKLRNKLRK